MGKEGVENWKRILAAWGALCTSAAHAHAHAASTCDKHTPQNCCVVWTADLVDGRGKWGAVTETTFSELQLQLEKTRSAIASLCRAYWDLDSLSATQGEQLARVCNSAVEQARCAEPRQLADRLPPASGTSAERVRLLQNVLLRIGRAMHRTSRLKQAIAKAERRVPAHRKTYSELGGLLQRYWLELADTSRSLETLYAQLRSLPGPQASADLAMIDAEADSLNAHQERVTFVVDGMVRALRPEGYEEDLVFAPSETGHAFTTDGMGRLFLLTVEYLEAHELAEPAAEKFGLSRLSAFMLTPETPNTYTSARWAYECHDGSSGTQMLSYARLFGHVCARSSLKSLSLVSAYALPVED